MANWYADTLECLEIIDPLDHEAWGMLTEGHDEGSPDPLIMLAWRCKKLNRLTLIG